AAALAVRETQYRLLRFVKGDSLGPSELVGFAEFLWQHPQIDDDAEIVKQSSEVGLAGIWIRNRAGKMTADEGASQGVFPEDDGVDAGAVFGHQVEHTARHCDVTDPVESEADDGAAQRVNFLPATKDVNVH